MLKVDGSLDHIPARRAHVVSLHESINQPLVNIPGYGAAPTGAFILSTRNDHGVFTVFVYLYQPQTQAVLIYVSEPRSLNADELRIEEVEAVRFVESMGFMVDNVHFSTLGVADQELVMERVPMFRPLRSPIVEGRPETRFGAVGGGVVTGRPETGPRTGETGSSSAGLLSGLHASHQAVPTSGRPLSDRVAERIDSFEKEPSRSGPSLREGPSASLGRGLPVPTTGETRKMTVGPAVESLARIGRLLGTFGVLIALLTNASCASTKPKERSRAQEATIDLGNQELARSRWAEALRHFQVALERDANDRDANRGAGIAYWRLGRLDDATAFLKKAVRSNPKWSEPKNELAVVYIERGQCREAIGLLKDVLDDVFYPTHHFAEHNLARAEACAGEPSNAVSRLEQLTRKRPKFCLAYLTSSEVSSKAELYEATIEACESFRENCVRDEQIGPKIPVELKAMCDLRKGRAYSKLGDIESARTAFERCQLEEATRKDCRRALQLLPP